MICFSFPAVDKIAVRGAPTTGVDDETDDLPRPKPAREFVTKEISFGKALIGAGGRVNSGFLVTPILTSTFGGSAQPSLTMELIISSQKV